MIGAQYLSTGLIRGAERASQYINTTTPKIISHIHPEDTPQPVPDSVRTGAKVARSVSGTAANVSGYIGKSLKFYVWYMCCVILIVSAMVKKKEK